MAKRLTAEQWLDARQLWESDPHSTFASVGERFGVSDEAVRKMAKRQGWRRPEDLRSIARAAQAKADAAEVGADVGGKVGEPTTKRPLAASIEQATDLRAKLIQAHRAEWRKHAAMFPLEDIKADYKKHGTAAKIAAEMIAIRQKAERIAWGLDDAGSQPTIVIERSYGK